jgi:tRNA(Ile)-lysidine synthase
MRLLRGAGTRGLAGIYPQKCDDGGEFIRPLLETRRADIEAFLKARKQSWREDSTNQDVAHARNQVRHELLPKLREFNPAIIETLANTADIARAEEDFWRTETSRLLPMLLLPGKATRGGGRAVTAAHTSQSLGLDLHAFSQHPLALQRRLLRAAAESLGLELEMDHCESILRVARGEAKSAELPAGWVALRSHRELRFERTAAKPSKESNYDYPAPIPGQVRIPDVNLLVHLHLMPLGGPPPAYNLQSLHAPEVLCTEAGRLQLLASGASLRVRNWQEGDRFRQAHSAGEKKVKDLLQELKVPKELRRHWPVVSAGDRILWVKGTRPLPLLFADGQGLQRLVIEDRVIDNRDAT